MTVAAMDDLWNLIAESGCAESIAELDTVLQRAIQSFDLEHYTYLNFSPMAESCTSTGNYPTEWVEHYISMGYQHVDPTAYCCEVLKEPFAWSQCERIAPNSQLVEQFWQEAKTFGLEKGVGIPNQSRDGSLCGWGFSFPHTEDEQCWLKRFGKPLAVLANAHHARFEQLIHQRSFVKERYSLTKRELEAIKWLCEGKTYWEIGFILSVSERTARAHINSARTKLGVATNAQLIVQAILHRLVM